MRNGGNRSLPSSPPPPPDAETVGTGPSLSERPSAAPGAGDVGTGRPSGPVLCGPGSCGRWSCGECVTVWGGCCRLLRGSRGLAVVGTAEEAQVRRAGTDIARPFSYLQR